MAAWKLDDFRPENQILIRAIAKVFFNGDLDITLAELERSSQERRDLDAKAAQTRKPNDVEIQLRFRSHQ